LDIFFYGGLAVTGFGAGLLGALLGLGGGVFVVPALVLAFGLPTLTAVGTSNVAVVATSTAGASTYVRSRLTNIRLALVLLVSTTLAALVSSLVASLLPAQVLSVLFAVILVYTAFSMLRGKRPAPPAFDPEDKGDGTAARLDLDAAYYDLASDKVEIYRPRRVRTGTAISALAGVIAGLLGVGGGIVQMPVMNLLMSVPIKAATGTSNFMVGITATSAAFVRYANGDIDPRIAVPVALFVFLGARAGAWLVPRTPSATLRRIFGYVALGIALLMLLQGLGIYQPPGR
jgi:uncharacterized membrane protein YfcA